MEEHLTIFNSHKTRIYNGSRNAMRDCARIHRSYQLQT